MVIYKILNNNVVITLNEQKKEQIIMGRGLAFRMKCGEEINEALIDKIYTLSSPDLSSKFQELVADIPFEHIEVSDAIITYAKSYLGKKLNENIYISLADHIFTAIVRASENITVKNVLLWDIKRFYKDEYFIGKKALEIIFEKFNIQLANDEAGFIALHILNAEIDDEASHDMFEITKIMQEVTNIVTYYYTMDFNEDSVYYYRFITHLKYFAQRLASGTTYDNSDEDDLLSVIQVKYKDAYKCVLAIHVFIAKKYSYELSNEEKLYLTIHIARIVSKNQVES